MKIMLVAATALSVLPLLLSLLMPNWYLGDQQNAVEDVDPDLAERRGSIALSRTEDEEEEELDVDVDV